MRSDRDAKDAQNSAISLQAEVERLKESHVRVVSYSAALDTEREKEIERLDKHCDVLIDDKVKLQAEVNRLKSCEVDAQQFRWLLSQAPELLCAIAWRVKEACAFSEPREAIAAAMNAQPLKEGFHNCTFKNNPDIGVVVSQPTEGDKANIIESGCRCGQRILIETDAAGRTCNLDGIRPHHPGDAKNITAFRCRTCGEVLETSCSELSRLRNQARFASLQTEGKQS